MPVLPLSALKCPPLLLESSADLVRPDQVRLLQSWRVEVRPGIWIKIPRGYVSDFFSVPTWLKSLFSQWDNESNIAAAMHDFAYEQWETVCQQIPGLSQIENPRLWCDTVFYEMLYRFRPNRTSRVMYYAVRLGGRSNWRKFRARNAAKITNQTNQTNES